MSGELNEWLGIKPADFVVYAAAGALMGMYYDKSMVLDIASASAPIACCWAPTIPAIWELRTLSDSSAR